MKRLKGIIRGGLGEGRVFMSMEHYRNELKQKLGFEIFPGTLNLEVDEEERIQFLKGMDKIIIEGFSKGDKSYGPVYCYFAKLNNVEGAVIVPERTKYGLDVIEFIAPVNLKKKLGVKDGDEVLIEAK